MKPELPQTSCFDPRQPDLIHLAHAAIDWAYSDTGAPRTREEANLCNWANWMLEGEAYEPIDLSAYPNETPKV